MSVRTHIKAGSKADVKLGVITGFEIKYNVLSTLFCLLLQRHNDPSAGSPTETLTPWYVFQDGSEGPQCKTASCLIDVKPELVVIIFAVS